MDLRAVARRLDEKSGLARFAPVPPTFQKVQDHAHLEALRKIGIGFVINIRPEITKIHRANCKATEAMVIDRYPKLYSETAKHAVEWVMTDQTGVWEHCGVCGGAAE